MKYGAPCPTCDAVIPPDAEGLELDGRVGSCPNCGSALVPARRSGALRRGLGASLDLGLLALSAGPLSALLYWLAPGAPLPGVGGIDTLLTLAATDFGPLLRPALPFLTLSGFYFLLFWGLNGQSPGQRLLGLRLVDRAGDPPGFARAGARVAAAAAAGAPLGLGWAWAIFDREGRALHDHLVGTWVVRNQ